MGTTKRCGRRNTRYSTRLVLGQPPVLRHLLHNHHDHLDSPFEVTLNHKNWRTKDNVNTRQKKDEVDARDRASRSLAERLRSTASPRTTQQAGRAVVPCAATHFTRVLVSWGHSREDRRTVVVKSHSFMDERATKALYDRNMITNSSRNFCSRRTSVPQPAKKPRGRGRGTGQLKLQTPP